MQKLQQYIRNHETLMRVLARIYTFVLHLTVRGKKGLHLQKSGAFLRHTKILNHGKNNTVCIEPGNRVDGLVIELYGDQNVVHISQDCKIKMLSIWCSEGSYIEIGHNTHFTGQDHIAATEGKRIQVGARGLWAKEVDVRTGDSHSILDETGKRINPAKDVTIGEHCWIGQRAQILKGANLGNETIVGAGAVITSGEYAANAILAGVPGREIRTNVTWHHELR